MSWIKWAKIAVWYPYVHIIENDGRKDHYLEIRGLQQDLIRRLHEVAPYALLENLRSLIIAEDRRGRYVGQTLDKVKHVWDSELEDMLLGLLRESRLSSKGQRSILDFLMTQESAEAPRVAEALIYKGYTNQKERDLVIEFSASLMASESEFYWPEVWKLFENDDDVGRAILEKVAEEERNKARFANKLSAARLVDLFIWVEERYPTSEDPRIDGFHTVTTREQVGSWRNNLITELRNKGNREGLDGIWWILSQFPKLEWLEFVRLDLEKAVEGTEWTPNSPREILDVVRPAQSRRFSVRQWCRDNQAEITAVGVVIGAASLFVAVLWFLWSVFGN